MAIKINGKNLTNMSGAYNNCTNLTGNPECGPMINDMSYAYSNCFNLTGTPIVGPYVTNMAYTYNNCRNLIGSPMTTPHVTNMAYTYYNCSNLIGSPTSGVNTTNMAYTYYNCYNLSGNPVCGYDTTNLCSTYYNCPNIYGIMPIYGNNVSNATNCFYNRNNSKKLSLVIANNSTTFSTIVNAQSQTILGSYIDWKNGWAISEDSKCYYNNTAKINVYAGPNVQKLTDDLKNVVVKYSTISTSNAPGFNEGFEYTITNTFNTQTRLFDYIVKTNTPGVMPTHIDLNDVRDELGRDTSEIDPLSLDNNDDEVEPMAMVLHYCTVKRLDYVNFDAITSLAYFCADAQTIEDLHMEFWDFTNVTNMAHMVRYCNITSEPICTDKITNMASAYYYCDQLTGQPVCGNNVTDMSQTYHMCYSLTGSPVCGPNVVNMRDTYFRCTGLTGSPVCGNNVQDFSETYSGCSGLTGSPVCGPNVTSMYNTYFGCTNLTGNIVFGPNVTEIAYAYYNCYRLKGNPVIGDKVRGSMAQTYGGCYSLTGSPVCTDNITSLSQTYLNCYNLTGKPVCGNNVTNMWATYANCFNLSGPAVIGPKVQTAESAYANCPLMYGNAYILSPMASKLRNCFYNKANSRRLNVYVPAGSSSFNSCINSNTSSLLGINITFSNNTTCYYNTATNLYIYPVSNVRAIYDGNERPELIIEYEASDTSARPVSVTGLSNGYTASVSGNTVTLNKNNVSSNVTYVNFSGKWQLTSIKSLCPTITSLSSSFRNCTSLKGDAVCGDLVTNMSNAYCNCRNLTNPVCGPNVTTMSYAYYSCYNLTGSPECGPNVTTMAFAYYDCNKMTGSPNCGSKVTNLSNAYYRCQNLTGSPVCSNSVTNMAYAYGYCTNLTGPAICGTNTQTVASAFRNCTNIGNNAYFFSNRINNATGCFAGKNNSRRLNVYVPTTGYNSTHNTLKTCLYTNTMSLVANTITWTQSGSNYYNTAYNIYICPVANVASVGEGTYSVSTVSGAPYGFNYDSSTGFYISGNKGVSSSYALSRVNISNPAGYTVYLDYIQSSESYFDYAGISLLNTALSLSNNMDTNDKLSHNLRDINTSGNVVTIELGVITSGFIDIKYRKDGSGDSGLDSFQFRLRFE